MKIQVWSDIMCPFCYIAKKNFEKALENLPFKNEVELEWKSFQLDPDFKENSGTVSIEEYLINRKGFLKPQVEQFQQQLKQMGKSAGITFNQDITIAADTFPAHKLLHFAKKYKKADMVKEALFEAHFLNGKNIANLEFLVSLAMGLGLDKDETEEILFGDSYDYEINQDIMEARNIGISGVPYYLINNKYAVSGAQPVETFVEAIQKAYQEKIVSLSQDTGNNMCGIDGCS